MSPRHRRLTAPALLLSAVLTAPFAVADTPTKKDLIRQARSATVFVVVPGRGTGSGFVVDRDERLVVTCAHVVGARADARAYFPLVRDGKVVAERSAYTDVQPIPAVVVDLDLDRDLCVLRLDRLPADAAAAPLAAESPDAGDDVFSVGNPGSSDALWVYTSGTVRQVYRKQVRLKSGREIHARTVETQAPINPGDSGGPLFNAAGKVVGVNSYVDQGAALFSSCIDVTEVATALSAARRWLRASTPDELAARARHYLRLGVYGRAVPDLDRLVAAKPDAASYLLRAEACLVVAQAQEVPARLYSLAVTDCVQALRLEPNSAAAYAVRAAAFLELDAADQAVADYSDAIRLRPEHPDHHTQRGVAHIVRKDMTAALKDFERALEIDPKASRPRVLRARVFLETKDFGKALEALDQAITAEPKAALLHDLRGDANVGLRRFDAAVRDYSRALDLAPDNPVFLTERARALNELGRFNDAAADCDKVLAHQPQNGKALYQRARAAHGRGRHAAALDDLDKVNALPMTTADDRRTHFDALVLRGRVHLFGTKEYDQAEADLTRALELSPNDPDALNLRGIAHARQNDHDAAVKDYTAALAVRPKSAAFLANRGMALAKQEKYADAVKDFTAAIEANPNYAPAYEQRSKAYEKLGDKEKAAADAAKAAELKKGAPKPAVPAQPAPAAASPMPGR